MNSNLNVKSNVDQGSQFWFDLDVPILNKHSFDDSATQDSHKGTQSDDLITFPKADDLEKLIEQVKSHNVLGIRNVIKELEQAPELETFLKSIQPFIENYRYRQLLDWLENNK